MDHLVPETDLSFLTRTISFFKRTFRFLHGPGIPRAVLPLLAWNLDSWPNPSWEFRDVGMLKFGEKAYVMSKVTPKLV